MYIGYGVTANITASHAVARGSIPRIRNGEHDFNLIFLYHFFISAVSSGHGQLKPDDFGLVVGLALLHSFIFPDPFARDLL